MNVTTSWLCFFGKASLGIMVIHKFPIVFLQMNCGIPAMAWGFFGGFPMMIVVTVVALSLTTVVVWAIQKTFPWLLGERCA